MPRKQKQYHYIYKTTCVITGRYYIGMHSTSNLNDGYIGSGKRLWRSINKHGRDNHKIEVLEFLPDRKQLRDREREIVNEELVKDVMCMNIARGGEGSWYYINHIAHVGHLALKKLWQDPEWREKKLKEIHENVKKQWQNPDYRKNKILQMSKHTRKMWQDGSLKGQPHKEESKRKIGEKSAIHQKGEGNSQYGTCWITNGTINKKIKKKDEMPSGWEKGRILKQQKQLDKEK